MIAQERKILKWREPPSDSASSGMAEAYDWIALEVVLTLIVNGTELVSFSSSPVHCQDLAVGFLFTEGVVSSRHDIANIDHDQTTDRIDIRLSDNVEFHPDQWNRSRTLTSGCGQGVLLNADSRIDLPAGETHFVVSASYFRKLFDHLKDASVWYERTGCIHQSALVSMQGPPIIREDIGRHNAVDKVIGAALMSDVDFAASIISSSGRLSSDMVRKAARAGVPIVVSRSAPTALAVTTAEEVGICLIGFARGRRLNVYSHPQRIKFESDAKKPADVGIASESPSTNHP